MRIQDKIAPVTGAGQGIGRAIALADITPEDLNKVLQINVAGVQAAAKNSCIASKRERLFPLLRLQGMKVLQCSVCIRLVNSRCAR